MTDVDWAALGYVAPASDSAIREKAIYLNAQKLPLSAPLQNFVAWVKFDSEILERTRPGGEDIRFLDQDGNKLAYDLYARAQIGFGGGAWSWFTNPRAIYAAGKTYLSYVKDGGAIAVSAYTHDSAALTEITLATHEDDDHNHAALYRRSDGRILACYTRHGADSVLRWQISSAPDDAAAFGAVQTLGSTLATVGATYANVRKIGGTLFWFFRYQTASGYGWAYVTSSDEGTTWGNETALAFITTNQMYLLAVDNPPRGRIDFVITNGNPTTNTAVAVYAGYITEGGEAFTSAGAALAKPFAPSAATAVLDATGGDCWILDIAIDAGGNPCALLQKRDASDENPSAYYFAFWDGSAWQAEQINGAQGAGSNIAPASGNNDYLGGACFGLNPHELWLSRGHAVGGASDWWHLEQWQRLDGTWRATRRLSDVRQEYSAGVVAAFRPCVPRGQPAGARCEVLWCNGVYQDYTNFHAGILAWPPPLTGAFVKCPPMYSGVETRLRLQYGNTAVHRQADPVATWSDWHLVYTPGEMAPGLDRSGSRTVDNHNSAAILNTFQNGGYSRALADDSALAALSLTSSQPGTPAQLSAALNLAGATEFSLLVHARPVNGGTQEPLVSNWQSTATTANYMLRINDTGDRLSWLVVREPDTQVGGDFIDVAVTYGAWGQFAGTFDATDIRAYYNGASAGAPVATGTEMDAGASPVPYLGATPHQVADWAAGAVSFLGWCKKKLSADYVAFDYRNRFDYSNFVWLGDEVVV